MNQNIYWRRVNLLYIETQNLKNQIQNSRLLLNSKNLLRIMLFILNLSLKRGMIKMGMMDDAIRETVKDKEFKKTDIKKLATRNKQIGGNHYKDCKIQPIDF